MARTRNAAPALPATAPRSRVPPTSQPTPSAPTRDEVPGRQLEERGGDLGTLRSHLARRLVRQAIGRHAGRGELARAVELALHHARHAGVAAPADLRGAVHEEARRAAQLEEAGQRRFVPHLRRGALVVHVVLEARDVEPELLRVSEQALIVELTRVHEHEIVERPELALPERGDPGGGDTG